MGQLLDHTARFGLPSWQSCNAEGNPLGSEQLISHYQAAWMSVEPFVRFPMQRFDWLSLAAGHFEVGSRLKIYSRSDSHGLGAAVLLETETASFPSRLAMLAVEELSEPTDFLVASDESVDALAADLIASGHSLNLRRLPADSPAVGALTRACRHRAVLAIRPEIGSPVIALNESWEHPEEKLNAGRRSDLRRARRRAAALGELETEILSPRPEELAPLLEEAFAIEARSWKGSEGTALAKDTTRGDFYRAYARIACEKGTLRLCFLKSGGKRIATQIALEDKGSFWLLKIGHDPAYSKLSPGVLLIHDTIAYAARQGLRTYEFLGTSEAWTRMWSSQERQYVTLRVYPYNANGLIWLCRDSMHWLWCRIRRCK